MALMRVLTRIKERSNQETQPYWTSILYGESCTTSSPSPITHTSFALEIGMVVHKTTYQPGAWLCAGKNASGSDMADAILS
eukprot:m.246943 g.246943  ORF g.246943 m.246943 type:complete len:81 (-) comp15858_c0_seq8:1174-1416(-)